MDTSGTKKVVVIGDTIRFLDIEKCEVIITGRTKHFLSLAGEHLSVENMNSAIVEASNYFNISIPEYTVIGYPLNNYFAHKWYVATNDAIDSHDLITFIDNKLKEINDDYATERTSALTDVSIEILPEVTFLKFMELRGKLGSQHKFPRVMKGAILESWDKFLATGHI